MARRLDYWAVVAPSELRLVPTTGSSANVTTMRKEALSWTTNERLVDDRMEWVTQVQVRCPRHQREMRNARLAIYAKDERSLR